MNQDHIIKDPILQKLDDANASYDMSGHDTFYIPKPRCMFKPPKYVYSTVFNIAYQLFNERTKSHRKLLIYKVGQNLSHKITLVSYLEGSVAAYQVDDHEIYRILRGNDLNTTLKDSKKEMTLSRQNIFSDDVILFEHDKPYMKTRKVRHKLRSYIEVIIPKTSDQHLAISYAVAIHYGPVI